MKSHRERTSVTEEELSWVVHEFYERVRDDAQLGPVFAAAIDDWPEHLAKLTSFWSSVMNHAGTYKGNPMLEHRKLGAEKITPARFTRWLELWKETTSEMLAPAAAARIQERAARIAVNLQHAVGVAAPRP